MDKLVQDRRFDPFAGHRFTILLAAQLLFLLTTVILHDALGGAHERIRGLVGVLAFGLIIGAGCLLFVGERGGRSSARPRPSLSFSSRTCS